MQFTSFEYISFFLIAALSATFLKGKLKLIALILLSFYFALVVSGVAFASLIILIFFYSVLNYTYVRFNLNRKKKYIFLISLFVIIINLLIFKYYSLLSGIVTSITGRGYDSIMGKLVPVGISYFSFQMIAYFIDIYNNRIEPEKNFLNFILFIVYFPKLLSGPIERGADFLGQLKKDNVLNADFFFSGLRMFVWGFFCKSVIADRLSPSVEKVFSAPLEYSSPQIFIGIVFFTVQIYADFGGYTYMALGASRMLGINLTNNFKAPFFSKSISEFWMRWHITLSYWLRDYIFIPLSIKLSRMESRAAIIFKNEKIVYIVSSIVTMSICGIWHGPKLTFFLWGLLHGIYLSFAFITRKQRRHLINKSFMKKSRFILPLFRTLFTFSMVVFAFVFFKSKSIGISVDIFSSLFGSWNDFGVGKLFFMPNEIVIAIVSISLMAIIDYLLYRKSKLNKRADIYDIVNVPITLILILAIVIFGKFGAADFIYFKF